jgi:hypothetical protein
MNDSNAAAQAIDGEFQDLGLSDAVAPAVAPPMPAVSDWTALMDMVAVPGEGLTRVSMVELKRDEESHLAIVIAGPERAQVMNFVLHSLDQLFTALDASKQPQA